MGEVEVRAAHNVLEACAQIDTVEKVVFTSSATAIIWGHENDQNSASMHLDERHWSDINFCRKFKVCPHFTFLICKLIYGTPFFSFLFLYCLRSTKKKLENCT